MLRGLVAFAALVALSGCGDVMRNQRIVGRYYLVAIDLSENTRVCFRPPNGALCAGEGMPDAAIFKAGGNQRYVVVARHPIDRTINRGVTEYYYIVREPNDRRAGQTVGPLDEVAFRAEAQRHSLPDFSITIDRLQ